MDEALGRCWTAQSAQSTTGSAPTRSAQIMPNPVYLPPSEPQSLAFMSIMPGLHYMKLYDKGRLPPPGHRYRRYHAQLRGRGQCVVWTKTDETAADGQNGRVVAVSSHGAQNSRGRQLRPQQPRVVLLNFGQALIHRTSACTRMQLLCALGSVCWGMCVCERACDARACTC